MALIRFVFCILFALVISGCGQVVTETLHVPTDAPVKLACPKTMVVMPFADYFYGDNLRTGLIRNSMVMEHLVDGLVTKGVSVPVQEDILQYLADRDIVTLLPEDDYKLSDTKSLSYELTGDWSDVMKGEIQSIIAKEAGRAPLSNDQLLDGPGVYALEKNDIQGIGEFFQADYLVRGRIIEYYLKQGKTTGFAYAPSQAVIHLRAWVQNTVTGEVVWTNRVQVKVAPKSDLVEDNDALFEAALSRAAATLIDDFWTRVSS